MKKAALCAMTGLLLLLGGCGDYREIEDVSNVAGLGLDLGEGGQSFRLTIEVVGVGDGKDSAPKPIILHAQGKSIMDTLRDSTRVSGEKLYFGHTEVLVVSRQTAEKGIRAIVDFLNRQWDLRLSLRLIVANENQATEIISADTMVEKLMAAELDKMMNPAGGSAQSVDMPLNRFITELKGDGIETVLPMVHLIENGDKKTPVIGGAALFKDQWMVGTLNMEQTEALLIARNMWQSGVITIRGGDQSLSFSLENVKCEIKPELKGSQVSAKLEVTTDLALDEEGENEMIINDKSRDKLERMAEQQIKAQLESMLDVLQNQTKSDNLGLGQAIHRHDPEQWDKLRDDWDSLFPKAAIEVTCKANLKTSGRTFGQLYKETAGGEGRNEP